MSRWCRGGVEKCQEVSRSVGAVSRWCRLTLVSMVSTRVDPCRPVSEGGLTVYTRVTCHSVDSVECRSVERVGVCQACRACRVCQVLTRHAPKRECRVAPGDFAGHAARRVIVSSSSNMFIGSLSTVACVRPPGALVAGVRTRSLTRFFFRHL